MAKDPVCNMEVEEEKAEFVIHLHRETFYFCSEQCKGDGADRASRGNKDMEQIFKEAFQGGR